MILDELLEFCEDFDCDSEPATLLATNQIDLGASPTLKNIGVGEPMYLVCTVTEAFTDGGDSATLNIRLRSDLTAVTHATTSTGHIDSGNILKAALTLGAQFVYVLPPQATYERFLGLQFVVTQGFDAGMITAGLKSSPPPGWVALPDAL